MATTHLIQISPNCREPSPAPHNAFVWRLEGGRRSSSFASQANPLSIDDEMGVVDDYHSSNHVDRNREEHEEATESDCQGCHRIRVDEERRQKLSLADLGAIHGAAFPNGTVDPPHSGIGMPLAANSSATSPPSNGLATTFPAHLQSPERIHQLKHDSSVLALAVNDEFIYAGTHDGEILVWSLGTFQLVQRVQAHKRSVLCLFLSSPTDKDITKPSSSDDASEPQESRPSSLLFSSAGDAIISVWCPRTLKRLYEIYSSHDVGDVFSVAYSSQNDTVYIGAQNTSIQWVRLNDPEARVLHESAQHPDRRYHRFFDSKAVGGTSTPRRNDDRFSMIPKAQSVLEISQGAIHQFAHFGYVYCMLISRGPTVRVGQDEDVLISGGGDGTIKLWRLAHHAKTTDGSVQTGAEEGIEEIMVLGTDEAESVLSLAIDGSFLYSGKLDGVIELWDLDTKQKLRVIKAHDADVMTLQIRWGLLWSAAANGVATKHSTVNDNRDASPGSDLASHKYRCLSRWTAHDGKILASAATSHKGERFFITGANDDNVCVWRVNDCIDGATEQKAVAEDELLRSLRKFVSYKTISSRPEYAEDCRRGATFLCSLFKRLGAEVEMLSSGDSNNLHNPVVFAKFSGYQEPAEKRKRILFYGHYDVVPADAKKGNWTSDPFTLTGTNGYLYGRGVSDNKGPIMAALYAVTDLMQAKQLRSDVVFLIEGEEESGSRSFKEAVRRNRDLIGDVDYILLANSYWLDDETPCLTYGLRGVLHATVCVDSPHPDLHSGVDGSYMMAEPLSDLTCLLSKLKGPGNKVMIPGFYDGVLPLTPHEEKRYDAIASILMKRSPENGPAEALKRSLMARWREPNLTIHRYKVSGPDGSLVSSHASANISLRLVPGQEVDVVAASLRSLLESEFVSLGGSNSLSMRIDNQAEPWLGDPSNEIFRTLENAVVKVWGLDANEEQGAEDGDNSHDGVEASATTKAKTRKPLYIREGGSIPAIRFLEKEFAAPAAHLPCGQASDAAHLDNERLRVLNLLKSREIFGDVFKSL
ncbi:WD repeat-containing protein [Pyricularia oryzae 70-15]|uniref:WD repeat-containing protein n=3 Tax=Pyricularia oryzae TaxID=318829 RepID=G4NFC5_PYRO7|nr:WD repeat-containing protein [Pyricularia oryzae 70-15]EHA47219.1 WD repeat-containing protein [Pyricularia oryzae 70-15]ELQ38457.1 WD repeat-containing protein [Pyricularia oryzae Y34]KAI7929159.1 WD repeat-containing protein [Pyricularia oryzae]KAI7930096.1 WD repeat-containing protein [Pyricularia oryzae]